MVYEIRPQPEYARDLGGREGFLYDCDGINDDLPYYTEVKGKPFLVVPYAFDSNDGKYWRNGWSNGEQFFELFEGQLRHALQGRRHLPKMLSIGLHSRVSGRPGRAMAVARFIEYAKGFPRVWFAGRDEIARWWSGAVPARIKEAQRLASQGTKEREMKDADHVSHSSAGEPQGQRKIC